MEQTQRVIALGFFDGVHLGHGGLLKQTLLQAQRLGAAACALTFDRHPASQLTGRQTPLLNTLPERKALMQELYGVEQVLVLPFDETIQNLSWERFAEEYLLRRYRARHLVCGHDYRFGAGGQGTPEKLSEFCRRNGLGFDCVAQITLEGQTVSSTHIRSLLAQGDVARAARFLGHPHILTGTVVDGRKVGRTLGIPTANLQTAPEILLPRQGVYAARTRVDGKNYPAVVNIGTRPTFGGSSLTVEPWLLDFDGDLYGRELRLEFFAYLRPERCFDTPETLQAEILENARQTRQIILEDTKTASQ